MMWDRMFINSVGVYLPERILIGGNENSAHVTNPDFGFQSMSKSDKPEHVMGGLAAKRAVAQSAHREELLSPIVYASTVFAVDHLNPACYLQRVLDQRGALAFQLNAASNGGMAGIDVVARLLSSDSSMNAGLLTAVSRVPDGMDQWMGGTLNGDGAVAAVVSKDDGFARIVASQSSSNPEFEVLGRNSMTEPEGWQAKYSGIDFTAYIDTYGLEIASAISQTISEAGVKMSNIEYVIVPAAPLTVLQALYLERNSFPVEKTCWSELRKNGHVGPCDQLLGLAYLKEAGQLKSGQFVLMVGVGLGFHCTCVLLEIV